ncbi:MAG: phenylalanine--tRNA ligase subunit beta [Bacilli bacterium]|nr:phenylalanine--tRNA ligase subunit beta [Bacilli bacterium]
MLVSVNWLKELLKLDDIDTKALANKMSSAGLEVEEIKTLASGDHLVIGQIKTCEEHPDSDHLHVLNVDVGNEVLQIVCGAPNVRVGLKVIVALPGANLPAIGAVIKKGTIRGVESNGMCCSLSELGVDKSSLTEKQLAGIEELGNNAPIGGDPLKYLGLDDIIFDVNITPNRGDAMSYIGVASDVAAILNKKLEFSYPKMVKTNKTDLTVSIDTDKCNVFSICKVNNITIKESPKWLKQKLVASGIRSINNIVDLGNYIMLLTGQPLHMYDYDKLTSNHYSIRSDYNGLVKMLDETDYKVEENDVVITNDGKVECLGGVMGSFSSMIDDNTKNIVIEAASFDGVSIRKTSRRLNLISDSSNRFVKETDMYSTKEVLALTVQVLNEISGYESVEDIVSVSKLKKFNKEIKLNINDVEKKLGIHIEKEVIDNIFTNLGFAYTYENEVYTVVPPTRRNDITIKEDLIEEIIRIYGFDTFTTSLPLNDDVKGSLTTYQLQRKSLREYLIDLGINDVINYSLTSKKRANEFNYLVNEEPVSILNPITEDHQYLRRSLVPTLLETINYNQSRNIKNIAVFEIAKVYAQNEVEEELLSIAINTTFKETRWLKDGEFDFYSMKGILEGIIKIVGIDLNRVSYNVNKELSLLHPGRSCEVLIDRKVVGYIGQIHPITRKDYDVTDTYVLEINLKQLLSIKSSKVKFAKFSTFPSSSRDISLLVKDSVSAADIVRVIKKNAKGLVTNIEIFDLYKNALLNTDSKSIAISLTYQAMDKTLNDNDINPVHQDIISKLIKEFNASIR